MNTWILPQPLQLIEMTEPTFTNKLLDYSRRGGGGVVDGGGGCGRRW